ncbi:MAG: tetratricopeptide repeat protein [Massilibacteroides sp.]|nr:tetratricopeptide repeat protein [Massilibacteroides sp.]MDD3061284.1 tetratricopeptide repeat protein [Massilibacteroides sp.]MDD4114873.1 tetratricopeptide repeat protein [Massilibacteroides sp.]MDD4659781.1 tetratricopeptide repeat protein [Massilibacteroides sp.]
MNKLILSFLLILSPLNMLFAQGKAPKWMNKSRNAVVTITTFDKDNRQLHSGTGFFISENGEVLTAYSILKGAARAQVTDMDGQNYPIERLWGADELYDVVRIQASIPKKVAYFPLAQEPVAIGSQVYLMLFSTEKKPVFKEGQIVEVSKLKDPYAYYKVSFPLSLGEVNSPLVLATGEVLGLAQEDASGKNEQSYAVSAGYAHSLHISSTDFLSSTYNAILIRKAWPEDPDQAIVALYLKRSAQNPQEYLETLNDFIATFPSAPDGYTTRASHCATFRKELAAGSNESIYLDKALEDINTAARYSKNPGDVHYNRAKLIFDTFATDTTITQAGWSVEDALQAVTQAIAQEDKPIYRQLQGNLYFYQQKFEDAYQSYMVVNESDMASPESYYMAAKAKENTIGFNIGDVIALLDKAIEKTGTPPGSVAATYILERVDWKMKLMMYPEAIADYDLYYNAVGGRVEAPFYYYREQAKFRAGDLEGALADIQQAIRMNPAADYLAEEASVFIRMEKYTEALANLEKALEKAPDFASCYRLKGVCLVRQGKKNEACEAFNKAKELGDPLANRLLREHCK